MNKNQFQFRRFWRLLRVKFAESIRVILYCILVFVVIMLVVRTGTVLLSLDNLSEGFEDGIKAMFRMPLYILLCSYFFGFVVIECSKNFFLCPVTNLERYVVIHTLPIFYMMMAAIVGIVSVEILWRLGLWIAFPSAYSQYLEVVAEFPFVEKFFSRVADFVAMFSVPYLYYKKIGLWENLGKYYEKKQRMIYFWVVPIVFAILIVGGILLLKHLGVPHITSVLLGIVILTDIFLIITSYRSFCNYEFTLEKTSNE